MTCDASESCRIGTSGYQYRHWRGLFYPLYLPPRAWFYHYALSFDTVEINSTFYGLPAAETFDRWRKLAPDGFCFALKYYRDATHDKRLAEPQVLLKPFLQAALRLREKLGPILVQLSPFFRVDHGRLKAFLEAVPGHLRWAVEFRHASWFGARTYSLLEAYGAALCIHDMLPRHPRVMTAGWTYFRYHATHNEGNYPTDFLAEEAVRLRALLNRGLEIYAYFNNDLGGHAVTNALELRRGLEHVREKTL